MEIARRLKAVTDKPVLIGVGISTPDQAVEACTVADGVVVGSALVRRLLEGASPADAADLVASFRNALEHPKCLTLGGQIDSRGLLPVRFGTDPIVRPSPGGCNEQE